MTPESNAQQELDLILEEAGKLNSASLTVALLKVRRFETPLRSPEMCPYYPDIPPPELMRFIEAVLRRSLSARVAAAETQQAVG